jgi:hypothetical protein
MARFAYDQNSLSFTVLYSRLVIYFFSHTPHITGSKKQSEERAALFDVRVHVLVSSCFEF